MSSIAVVEIAEEVEVTSEVVSSTGSSLGECSALCLVSVPSTYLENSQGNASIYAVLSFEN